MSGVTSYFLMNTQPVSYDDYLNGQTSDLGLYWLWTHTRPITFWCSGCGCPFWVLARCLSLTLLKSQHSAVKHCCCCFSMKYHECNGRWALTWAHDSVVMLILEVGENNGTVPGYYRIRNHRLQSQSPLVFLDVCGHGWPSYRHELPPTYSESTPPCCVIHIPEHQLWHWASTNCFFHFLILPLNRKLSPLILFHSNYHQLVLVQM